MSKYGQQESIRHRVTEVVGLVAFAVIWVIHGLAVWKGLVDGGTARMWWLVPLVALAAYLGADFISGFVHFLADNFGSPTSPYWGESFVGPFRQHHDTPKEICEHDFIELNGNNALISIPVLVPTWLFVPTDALWGQIFSMYILFFLAGILATNQIHMWAHSDDPPRIVQWMQRVHLILPRDHHQVHHNAPHDRNYCITVGWLNPLLDGVGFFATIVRIAQARAERRARADSGRS